ncbi:MAG: hypothetical protein IKG61_07460, partial [Selenomonadaceae bacterium]|nr:hypothetical protein [Selenomonadaceae bacterium]
DEFLAFCEDVRDEKIIFNKARFLNHQLLISAKNFMGADMNIPLGTSIGAVFVPDEGRDFQTLMDRRTKLFTKSSTTASTVAHSLARTTPRPNAEFLRRQK